MLWYGAKHNLYIGKAKVCIQYNDPLSQFFKLTGKVY